MNRSLPRAGRQLAVAVPVATAAVLAVQVQLARRGRRLEAAPLILDGLVVPALARPEGGDDDAGDGDTPAGETDLILDGLVVPALALPKDDDDQPTVETEVLRMAWLGDSTAAGVGATSPDLAVPRRVAALLGRRVDVASFAQSGARVADVLADQVPRLRAPGVVRPDVITISVGANDVTHLTAMHRFIRTYEVVLDQLPPAAEVVLLGVPDMGSMPRVAQPLRAIMGWRGRRMAAAVRRIAAARELGFVDIAEATGRVFRDAPGPSFAGDQYHPSDEGYRVWAAAVAPVVQEEIARGRP